MKDKTASRRCIARALGLVAAVAATLPAPLSAQAAMRSLVVGGVTRTYRVYRPPTSSSLPRPLVIVLHGAGGSGRQIAAHTGFDRLADRERFVVVYPDGLDRRWNDGRGLFTSDDVGFMRALLDTLQRAYRIDSTRIFATGISNGAMLAHRLACELPGTLAAIAPVAGAMPAALVPRCTGRPVSVLAFQGTADRLVPYEGGSIASSRGDVLSARATAAHWATASRCHPQPQVRSLPDRHRDGTRIQRLVYSGCGTRAVELYAIIGGGHTWPGGSGGGALVGRATREIDGSEVIWKFFERVGGGR